LDTNFKISSGILCVHLQHEEQQDGKLIGRHSLQVHDAIAEEGEGDTEHWDEDEEEDDEDDDDDKAEQESDSDAEDEDEQGDYEASC
jgi:hypothetical protein